MCQQAAVPFFPTEWIRTRKTKTRRAGLGMWEKRAENYTHLRACPENIMLLRLSYLICLNECFLLYLTKSSLKSVLQRGH